jgi:hypothetical protein
MTKEANIPSKILWPTAVIAVVGMILLAVLLEQMLAPEPAADPVPTPHFSAPSGTYDDSFSLKLTPPAVPGAQVIYTINGRSPTPDAATLYDTPIPLHAAEPALTIVRARTQLPDGTLSEEVVGTYAMALQTDLPIFSLIAEPEDLWSEERGILSNPIMRGSEWERPAHITYVDENGRFGFNEPVGIRLHGQGSSFTDKKSLRIYFRREYGSGRLNYPLYPDSDISSFDRLVLHSGGQDNNLYSANWTLMRTQLMAKLSGELNTFTTYNQPVLTFINGELQGIYYLRERLDETYFQDYFGIDNVKILNSPHRDQDQPEEVNDWWALDEYAATHDMADPAHYNYVLSQIDVENMIDHYILQMYAANTDWPYNNEILFRGGDPLSRWRWFLWDVDYSFGMLPSSNFDVDMVMWMLDPQSSRVRAASRFFRSLWQNPDFRNRFLVRSADLFNTTLSPENVSEQLAEVEAALINDIGYEIARWGSAGNWYASAAEMHTFAQQRTDLMRQQYVDGFSLRGTAVLTLNAPASGQGILTLNHTITPTLPYISDYFLDTTITVTANPEPGYQFAGWDINGEMIAAETAVLHHTITQDTTITPHFTKTK